MSKLHTPGPWVADLETYPVMVRSASETWPLVDELGKEEGRAGIFVANTGDNKANASLIAAAPDLLEALNTWLEQYSAEEYEDCPEVVQTRAAIAKATGKA